MIDKFNEFRAISGSYNERINQLEAERLDLKARRAALETQYENMIAELVSDSELQAAENEIETLDMRLAQIEKMLEIVKRGKRQKLAEMIPTVKAYRDQKKAEKLPAFDAKLRDVMKAKAEYLLKLRELKQLDDEIAALHSDVLAFKNEAEIEESEFFAGPLSQIPVDKSPALEGAEIASRSLAVSRWLIDAAMQGRFPQWIDYYAKHGKLPEEVDQAAQKRGGKR
jgi:chromosome segregation ATPase